MTALELVAAGEQVVMNVRGPGIGPPISDSEEEHYDQASIVFTLRDGKIVRMQDFMHRQDALNAAHALLDWQ